MIALRLHRRHPPSGTAQTVTDDLDVALTRLEEAANRASQSRALRRNLGELHAILADLGAAYAALCTHRRQHAEETTNGR